MTTYFSIEIFGLNYSALVQEQMVADLFSPLKNREKSTRK